MLEIIIDTAVLILSLGSGVASILVLSWLFNRYNENFVNTFMYYQILVFIYGIYGIINTFFVSDFIAQLDISANTARNIVEFMPYLAIPVIITAWFLFIKTCNEMVNRNVSSLSAFAFFGVIIFALAIYILVVHNHHHNKPNYLENFVLYSKYGYLGLAILSLVIAYSSILTGIIRMAHKPKKKMAIKFMLISILMNMLSLGVFYFHELNAYLQKLNIAIYFVTQIPIVLFLYYYMNKNFIATVEASEKSIKELMIMNYDLSPREWEIVEQICKGYTNSQISDNLFISLQTVKDHVSRVYRKTGVKNRVQLVNKTGMLNNS